MTSYQSPIEFLYGLQKSGMKFGLRNIRTLLKLMGNPERSFPTVHIAGSNGKGSTAALIAAVLSAAGYRTGLYTSPHLVSFGERIRVNGRPMGRRALERGVRRIRNRVRRIGATFFETTTAMAFEYFRDKRIDIGVIETGLGGRLDATNVLHPIVSVITTISREHTEILGNLLGEIAYEKGGIIKRGVPCFTGRIGGTARLVLSGIAQKRRAPLMTENGWKSILRGESLGGSIVDIKRPDGTRLRNLRISLPGGHQLSNALLALRVVEDLRQRGMAKIEEKSIRKGFRDVRQLTGFRSRLSLAGRRPDILLDVAHNPEAASALALALRKLGWTRFIMVFGVMKDKEFGGMIDSLQPLVSGVVVVQPATERAVPSSVLAEECKRRGIRVLFDGGVRDGIRHALVTAGRRGRILVTGSHFVVGETLALLERKNYLTINQ